MQTRRSPKQIKEDSAMATDIAQSIYEQLGGMDVIGMVVDEFYGRVLTDDTLSYLFAGKDLPALKRHQTRFISYALGGPNQYTGRSMRKAHEGLAITPVQFAAVAWHLRSSLEAFAVPEGTIDQIITHVASLQDDIVGQ
jgi:hemoglobin